MQLRELKRGHLILACHIRCVSERLLLLFISLIDNLNEVKVFGYINHVIMSYENAFIKIKSLNYYSEIDIPRLLGKYKKC